MRSRIPLFALLLVAGTLALPLVAHAGIPFFGPIIPPGETARCAGSWGLLIDVMNRFISLLLTLAIVFVAPLMVAWAGFLFVVNPVNASGISQAKSILTHTVVGIVVALAGYMIVAALMAVLYNATAPVPGTNSTLGTWSALISSNGAPLCLNLAGSFNPAPTGTPSTGVVGTPSVGTARGPCLDSNTACSVSAIQQGAQAIGMTLTTAQATAMSCIAMTESGGNPYTPNSSTGACGTFQITTRPGNWSLPQFHRSPCSTSSSCNDAQCNLQTAMLMMQQRGYQPWTGRDSSGAYWNPNAVACVQRYDPNTSLRTI